MNAKAAELAIEAVSAELGPIHSRLCAAAHGLAFDIICDLSVTEEVAKQQYSGIYRIDVGTNQEGDLYNWLQTFKQEWDLPELHQKFTCTTKKKRFEKHATLMEWMPLYIGKSKNIAGRVKEHWSLPMATRTFALKIAERPNMRARRFQLSTLRLPVENYDFIAPVIERELRDAINPLVGRQ